MARRILSLVTCLAMVFMVAACSSNAQIKHVDGELSEIFAKIYENANAEEIMTIEMAVDENNKASMLGSADVDFIEGLASEAAIMTIPHSMVLIRVDTNSDIEKTKQLIKDNVNPRKWICVGVESDQVIVDNIGDLVFLVMSAQADAYHESFLQLAK